MSGSNFDVIVVGAGNSGATLAARLSERSDRRVLLLEAGPDYTRPEDFPVDVSQALSNAAWFAGHPNSWNFTARVLPDRNDVHVARGRIMGGSSTINGTVFQRGRPLDFDAWASRGHDLWSYEQVLPFYLKCERDLDFVGPYHGDDGPMPVSRPLSNAARAASEAFIEACLDHGFPEEPDKNLPGTGGVGPIPRNVREGFRVNAAMAYLTPGVRARPNLTVQGDTYVRRVLFDGTKVTGVETETDGTPAIFHAAQVILSAGALKSPQLLLLSGVGPAGHLGEHGIPVVHDSPGVGTHVKDHISAFLRVPIDDGVVVPENSIVAHSALHHTAPGSDHTSDLELAWGKVGTTCNIVTLLNHEYSTGMIGLASADPTAQPAMDFNFLTDAADLPRIAANVRLALAFARSAAFRKINAQPELLDIDDTSDATLQRWIRENISTALHTHNTTPMGAASDPEAVIDQRCRVLGVDGLRVADVGIIPAIRNGPSASGVMIGERVAALIDEDR